MQSTLRYHQIPQSIPPNPAAQTLCLIGPTASHRPVAGSPAPAESAPGDKSLDSFTPTNQLAPRPLENMLIGVASLAPRLAGPGWVGRVSSAPTPVRMVGKSINIGLKVPFFPVVLVNDLGSVYPRVSLAYPASPQFYRGPV